MLGDIDLKRIERKMYTSYHQDGLIDIWSGLFVVFFGIGIITEMVWLGGVWAAIFVAGYASLKKSITMPRLGYVEFASGSKSQRWVRLLLLSGVLVLVGAFVATTFTWLFNGSPSPIFGFIRQNFELILGLGGSAVIGLVGYILGVRRFYIYAILGVLIFTVGHLVLVSLGLFPGSSSTLFGSSILVLGALILAPGLVVLLRFLRRYPLKKGDRLNDEI
ncbi:MAG: hypothetical protein ACFFA1_08200 [Promethearchaeota archaeon]